MYWAEHLPQVGIATLSATVSAGNGPDGGRLIHERAGVFVVQPQVAHHGS